VNESGSALHQVVERVELSQTAVRLSLGIRLSAGEAQEEAHIVARYVGDLIPLAFLALETFEAIVARRQPPEIAEGPSGGATQIGAG